VEIVIVIDPTVAWTVRCKSIAIIQDLIIVGTFQSANALLTDFIGVLSKAPSMSKNTPREY